MRLERSQYRVSVMIANPFRTGRDEFATLEDMQLRNARLCLDCEEVHDGLKCPVCASDQFTYLTRWVPAPERRERPRPAAPPSAELEAYRRLVAPEKTGGRLFARALVGLGAASVLGLFVGSQRARARQGRDDGQPADE